MGRPIFSRRTVNILSTAIWDGMRKPFCSDGTTVMRIKGALNRPGNRGGWLV